MIDGSYTGANAWESDCGRFRAIRLSPSSRKWIVIEQSSEGEGKWSRSYNDLESARIDMTSRLGELD